MHQFISKYLLSYPIQFLRKEHIAKKVKEIGRTQWLSSAETEEYQFNKIKKLIEFAYKNVPYYKHLFENYGITPKAVKDFDDFGRLPLLTKDILRTNLKKLCIPSIMKKSNKRTTSGCTGTPLVFYKDRRSTGYLRAARYRNYKWYNVDIGEKHARFWGTPLEKDRYYEESLKDFIMNRVRLSAFKQNNIEMNSFLLLLRKFNPSYFYGYPNAIFTFANFIADKKISLDFLRLKAIFSTGEVLFGFQKEVIEKVFKCRVVNEYGSSETGIIAFECPEGNMHIMSENVYVEFIKKNSSLLSDEKCEIVLTDLNSLYMPLIRYKIGDIGRPSDKKCNCGRGLPIMELIEGRIDDYIITTKGYPVYDAILAYTLKKGVKQFKVVQKQNDKLIVSIVKDRNFTKKDELNIKEKWREYLGHDMQIIFEYVREIYPEKSGKLRYFVSELNRR